ncbi:cellulase [Rhodanobacter sp. B05]|nr:cellulase [Rhodanobacter sp. B05]
MMRLPKPTNIIRLVSRCLLLLGLSASLPVAAQRVSYAWHNVRIGGGGYVSGLVFHPAEKGLYYARTDVGGAYRWDAVASHWVPLTDWIGAKDHNLMGIDSLALDPADPDWLYLAAGTYTVPQAGNAAILRSHDRGHSFERVDLPFPLGGNELGRGNGERLAVDPNDGAILFLGSRTAGLWRSADHAAHWSRVDSFPAVATSLAATATNSWRRQPIGIVFVVFDPTSAAKGRPTQVVYAGVSTRETSLFRSTDGGAHWSAVPGQPIGLRPNHMTRGADGNYYLTYGDEPGPDQMHDGAVWKFSPTDRRWTDITPIPRHGKPSGFGWGDIAVDAHDPNILLATTFCHYTPYDEIYRSIDGGRHWAAVFPRSSFDYSNAAWTRDHHPHWMSDIAIDPFDPDHVLFVTGYGVWASRNMRAFDHGGTVNWWFQDTGLEETVPLGLASPAEGAHLLSAVGDLDGFRHDDLDVAPMQFAAPPRYANGYSIEVAGRAPQVVVRTGRIRDASGAVRAAYSLDGAKSWHAFASEPGGEGEGSIAVAADGRGALWFPLDAGNGYVTHDWGRHWSAAHGLPKAARVFADRVDPQRFYAQDLRDGALFLSRDGGLHFEALGGKLGAIAQAFHQPPQRPTDATAYAVPGRTGELYLISARAGVVRGRADGSVLWQSTTIEAADSLGFGRAAAGRDEPTLFLAGKVAGQRGLFRSIDSGAHWLRINDDAHQYGELGHVTGDPRQFGRVYFASGGRGIFYGDPAVSGPRTAAASPKTETP